MINHFKATKRTQGFHLVRISNYGIVGQRYIKIPLEVDVHKFKDMMEILISDDSVKYKIIPPNDPSKSVVFLLELTWFIPESDNDVIIYHKVKVSIGNAERHVRAVIREKISFEKSKLSEKKTSISSETIKQFLYD